MSKAQSPRRYLGVRAVAPPDLQLATRNPTSSDTAYVKGQLWLNTSLSTAFMWPGSGNWISLGSGTTGAIVTLTGGSGGALSPTAGNMNLLGTANQITSTGSGSTITFSIPSTFIAPGSIASTTSITAGNGLTVTLGNLVVSAGNISTTVGSISSATTVTAGTGLTITTGDLTISSGDANVTGNVVASKSSAGADVTIQATNSDNTNAASRAGVEIAAGGASGGDPYLSFQISGVGASTMTMGLDNSASDLFVISNSAAIGTNNALTLSQAGALNLTTSITAGTTLTATLGDITATNGNIVRGTAGNKDVYSSVATTTTAGANSAGTVTLVGGTATVSTTAVTADSKIRLTRQGVGATGANPLGLLSVGTITAATSFVINAWSAADATALAATDVSSIFWEIVN